MIRDYFNDVERILSEFPQIHNRSSQFTSVDLERGYWKARLEFRLGYELHLFEYVLIDDGEADVNDYRYHFQDSQAKCLFRFDNAPHHPDVESHPHHLHTSSDIKPAPKPDLNTVLRRAVIAIEQD